MESSQAQKDLSSLLKIHESCSIETGYGIFLLPAGRQISVSPNVFMAFQMCSADTSSPPVPPLSFNKVILLCLFKDSKFQSDHQLSECFQGEAFTSYQNTSTPGFLLSSCPFCAFPESTYERPNYC